MTRIVHDIPSDFFAHFEPIEVLGQGSAGLVIKALSLPKRQLCAVKILRKSQNAGLSTELQILRSVSHPCVIKLLAIEQGETHIFLKLELAEAGALSSYTRAGIRFSEDRTRLVMRRVLEGLVYLHSKGIIHRDIKPENILLAKQREFDSVKVTDFSLSALTCDDLTRRQNCGTLIYMAPQVLRSQEYSFKVDVFALSLVMFKMLEGRHPFFVRGITNQYYIKLLTTTEPTPALKWSNECLSLFRRISRVDPAYRYTAAEALTHPWFTGQPLHMAPLSSQEAIDFQEVSQQLSRSFWQLMISGDAQTVDQAYSLKAARFVRRESEGEVKMTLKHLDELLGPYDYLACKQQKATKWINDSHPKIMQLHEIYDNILYRKPVHSVHKDGDGDGGRGNDAAQQLYQQKGTPADQVRELAQQAGQEKDNNRYVPLPREVASMNEPTRDKPEKDNKRNLNDTLRNKLKSVCKAGRLRNGSMLKSSKRKIMSGFLRSTK